MRDHWELLDAREDEHRLFHDLESSLALEQGVAADPNRFRQVLVLRHEGRTWFLKQFHHTQWKNRWRSRLTAPRCVLDGDRERLVAVALAQRGVKVARPVASGRRGGASYYLCAELDGESLRDLLVRGELPRDLAMAAARFAGSILQAGVRLPDLSTDHVFVMRGAKSPSFAVIDLHNGSIGPTSVRLAARILRRFARSLRGLDVPRQTALAFACRLLAAAGFSPARRRRIITAVPPMDTHGRYEVVGRSRAYRARSGHRTRRELDRLRSVWPGSAGDLVLDSPAGAGRLQATLTEEFGARRLGADRAMAMLRESRAAGDDSPLCQADAAALPFHDQSMDGVVVFRFLHHLDEQSARRVLAEATRVARRYVVVTFFHPVSVHGVVRRLKEVVLGRARTRFSVRAGRLAEWMSELGFLPTATAADQAYRRDLWITAFQRR